MKENPWKPTHWWGRRGQGWALAGGRKSAVLLCMAALLVLLPLSACGSSSRNFLPYASSDYTEIYQPADLSAGSSGISLMGQELCVIGEGETGSMASLPELGSEAALAIDEGSGKLLYQKNAYEKLYPASLTKLMTAYVVYEEAGDRLEELVTVTAEAITLPDSAAKKCGLQAGDVISLHELLYASLVTSANDAAKALAIAVSGSEEEFVKEMNRYAKQLGATQSHFSNCHGLHAEDHYSTIYDMYLIFHELLKNEDFVSVIQEPSYELAYTNASGTEVKKTITSTNQYHTGAMPSPSFFKVIGGKTGTTNQAGSCMMLYCQGIEGGDYIVSILKAADPNNLYSELGELFENIPAAAEDGAGEGSDDGGAGDSDDGTEGGPGAGSDGGAGDGSGAGSDGGTGDGSGAGSDGGAGDGSGAGSDGGAGDGTGAGSDG